MKGFVCASRISRDDLRAEPQHGHSMLLKTTDCIISELFESCNRLRLARYFGVQGSGVLWGASVTIPL